MAPTAANLDAGTGPRHASGAAGRKAQERFQVSAAADEDGPVDYWEEVALSRLRLAQWALCAALVGSVVLALILG